MYGLLDLKLRTLKSYKSLKTIEDFGLFLIKLKLKEEGKEFIKADILEHLNEWAETINDIEESDEFTAKNVIEIVSDNYVYCDAHHYNDRTPLNAEERKKLYNNILERFTAFVN